MLNTVVLADTGYWDSIQEIVVNNAVPLIAAQNRPTTVSNTEWCQNISETWYSTGAEMADAIAGGLGQPAPPAVIMIDELRGNSIGKVYDCANRMRTVYPQYEARWGAYIVNGYNVAYPNLNPSSTPAIDELLRANAILACEFYAKRSDYCVSASSAAGRDQWLEDFFVGSQGSFPQGRFRWLVQRRNNVIGSASRLTAVFGVTDNFMDGSNPAIFLDRMFYVWVARTGYRGTLLADNGGAGSWKWDSQAVGTTGRDLAFRDSWNHYCLNGSTSSRLGQVPC